MALFGQRSYLGLPAADNPTLGRAQQIGLSAISSDEKVSGFDDQKALKSCTSRFLEGLLSGKKYHGANKYMPNASNFKTML